jgi:putative ATP-dependent endonuclease of the OLD family
MYISELKLWNFRKYGHADWDLDKPHLIVPFSIGVNVLIGENDSGKTAILDAIKLVLKTHAYEWIKVDNEDFYNDSSKLRIEIKLKGLTLNEAKNFTEWLGWEEEKKKPVLRLIYEVEKRNERIQPADIRAGMDEVGYPLNAEARDYLKTTYLKALRDADSELIAKKNSRVSQILLGHDLFKEKESQPHEFVGWFDEVNTKIRNWFEKSDAPEGETNNRKQIKDVIDNYLKEFIEESFNSELQLSEPEVKAILEKISLGIEGSKNLGLGTMNRLFMAAELLHLKKDWNGLKLCLIEELEAHLHPQAQMKIIEALQKEIGVQFILTTHSPNLASKVDINRLIICNGNEVFPLRKVDTKLEEKDYKYLKRFLDVTKSNLFFAKGVIIVEGWSEEILIPAIADVIGFNLTKHEVSVVNVGSTAYLHFARIFIRNDEKKMNIPVSVITDLDVRPDEEGNFDLEKEADKRKRIEKDFQLFDSTDVQIEIAKQWTLEWCLYKSLSISDLFKEAVSKVHSGTDEFKKGDNGQFKPEFQKKLIQKLIRKEGTSPLDKVAVANTLAELISENEIAFNPKDEYIMYLFDSIKHACRM